MDLEATDEQKMLADTVDGLLDKRYDANIRLKLLDSDDGWSRELWKQYAELGLLGLPFDEQYGGAGMGIDELAVVMESFGRALVLEPYLATVVLGGSLVARAGSPEQKAAVLPGVADGSTLLAFAYTEAGSRWSLTDITTTASVDGETVTVSGAKIAVLGGDSADHLVVTARTPDGEIGLFLVDASDAGVGRSGYPMQDGLRGADVMFVNAPAQQLGAAGDALGHIEATLDVATAALCAEAIGAMDRMLWLTVDYLKTRVQFGQPISVFQALQHRAANMYVSLDLARSMALAARLALADDDVEARRRLVRAAKAQIDASARHVGQEAVQLHGGIGMTMEYPVGHYLKRTTVIAKTFADTDRLVEQVGQGDGLIPAG
ncbi:acyl-CoA dehydrogenase family protein [uncultured Jatrophihabitans sp.]|uniref:acyl-CoA dehydrogenase family protein n=1 Tax=uncultured Jatrophihabitans sp. TaxID=1610747 RepID=UPI0035CB3C1E